MREAHAAGPIRVIPPLHALLPEGRSDAGAMCAALEHAQEGVARKLQLLAGAEQRRSSSLSAGRSNSSGSGGCAVPSSTGAALWGALRAGHKHARAALEQAAAVAATVGETPRDAAAAPRAPRGSSGV